MELKMPLQTSPSNSKRLLLLNPVNLNSLRLPLVLLNNLYNHSSMSLDRLLTWTVKTGAIYTNSSKHLPFNK
jgi:hypothetical protein